jgi:hypothetical protein
VAGQQLANLIGLFIWNLRICRGMELVEPPAELPPQAQRASVVAEPAKLMSIDRLPTQEGAPIDGPSALCPVAEEPRQAPQCIAASDGFALESSTKPHSMCSSLTPHADDVVATAEVECAKVEVPPAQPEKVHLVPGEGTGSVPHEPGLPEGEASDETQTVGPAALAEKLGPVGSMTASEANNSLQAALASLDWPALLDDKPGWRWIPEKGGILCPNGQLHCLQSVKIQGLDTKRTLRFLAPYLACADCPIRAGCTSSDSRTYRREIALAIPTVTAYPIHQLYSRSKGHESPPPPAPIPPARSRRARRRHQPLDAPESPSQLWDPPCHDQDNGNLAVSAALLLPARLRQAFARAHRQLEVHVHVKIPKQKEPVDVFAMTPGDRQNRRLTWAQREQWNRLPDGSLVRVQFVGGDALAPMLPHLHGADQAENAA